MVSETCDVVVVGGGPAGLRAAEVVSAAGLRTMLADQMRSAGRKFLVAGRGGLNLTHSEPLEDFHRRYGAPADRWQSLLADFSPQDLRAWAEGLGIETFVGSSRRVFPISKQAAPLLRRWIEQLRQQGVSFRPRHRLVGFRSAALGEWEVRFENAEGPFIQRTRAIVLALGGASWPQTGSDGEWTKLLAHEKIPITPLSPANCGYEVNWSPEFLAEAEGLPLKNIVVSAAGESVGGELLITRYGLEGGTLYQLGRALRSLPQPAIAIDLKPAATAGQLAGKISTAQTVHLLEQAAQAWRLSPAAQALLRLHAPFASAAALAALAKSYPLLLCGPRPIAEAISTAGGVAWGALNEHLMLKGRPGIFCAGEMIDWEAPTGGYLLQGCFSTGTRAAQGTLHFLKEKVVASTNPEQAPGRG
jgi:uncharacterized flavoprotein (TIGR03862 family)